MRKNPEIIVMLTYNDQTVANAYEIFDECKNSKAQYWGMKEMPLPKNEMIKLYDYMRQCGKKTVLEVVEYTEKECIEGAKLAVDCRCDILMGTIYSDKVNEICKENAIKYMPFVGEITERPSILNGSIEGMVAEAKSYIDKGVHGIDLLGYRYTGDCVALNKALSSQVPGAICLAGSVNSFERLDEVKEAAPWGFTIGSAFFDNAFGDSISEQIDKVCDYINS